LITVYPEKLWTQRLLAELSQYIDNMNDTPTIFKWKYKMDKIAGGIVMDQNFGVLIV
jgi:hypothetical protein